jgi:LysM repeat protein
MKFGLFTILFCLVLMACAAPPETPATLPITALTPWSSPTPAPTNPSAAPAEVEPVSLPTPEPRTHIIEKGEDLGGLALKYGVSLAEIMAANPAIDPRMISIGTAIIIPSAGGEATAAAPQASEAGVSIQPPHCLKNAGGDLTCFSAVQNDDEAPVENISLNFILLDADQNEIASQLSYAPLNLLPGGAVMPFLANFQEPLPSSYSTRADLAGALPGTGSPDRYLSYSLEGAMAEIAADGLSARVTGQVQLAPDQANAGTTWVLAVGYNRSGDVICFRRWEDTAGIEAGQSRPFEFTIYSSVEKIERVEFLSESRP